MSDGNVAHDNHIFKRFFMIACLVVGLCVSAIFLALAMRSKTLLFDQMVAQARAHFQSIVITRKWSAQHGGVYVIKRPGMQSNPYLETPDIEIADGRVLTLKNPALMTREISELANENNIFTFRITSLHPLNPDNTPDSFETIALREFEAGVNEYVITEKTPKGERLRYMAPLFVEQSCLTCHAHQGYSVGQVRGGISVSLSIEEVNKALRQNNLIIAGLNLVTVGLLLATLGFFFRQMRNRLHKTQEMLLHMATTDMLTNVANRASLMHRFKDVFFRQRRNATNLGCLMIDVDHFKAVNDRYGHPQGDTVLKELAAIISPCLRPYDTFGRYGGEEFMMIIDGVDADMLATIAERTRAEVEAKLGKNAGLAEVVTISLGGTLVEPKDQDIDDIIRRADEALYKAKHQGRNRVVLLTNYAGYGKPLVP